MKLQIGNPILDPIYYVVLVTFDYGAYIGEKNVEFTTNNLSVVEELLDLESIMLFSYLYDHYYSEDIYRWIYEYDSVNYTYNMELEITNYYAVINGVKHELVPV